MNIDQSLIRLNVINLNEIILSVYQFYKLKYYINILCSPHKHLQKEAIFKYYNQNTEVLLYLIPFLATNLVPGTKVHKLVLTLLVKLKDNIPNFYNFKICMCMNGNENSKDK